MSGSSTGGRYDNTVAAGLLMIANSLGDLGHVDDRSHHDHIDDNVDLMCGPRLLTAFFYFADLGPEDGGATKFTNLGFQVEPKIGR